MKYEYDLLTREGITRFSSEHLAPIKNELRRLDARLWDCPSLLHLKNIRRYQMLMLQKEKLERIIRGCADKVAQDE